MKHREKQPLIETEFGNLQVDVVSLDRVYVGAVRGLQLRLVEYHGKPLVLWVGIERTQRTWKIFETSSIPRQLRDVVAAAFRIWIRTHEDYIRREAIKKLRGNLKWFSERPPLLGGWSIHRALREAQELVDEATALGRPKLAKPVRVRLLDVSRQMDMTALHIRNLLKAA